MCADRDVYVQCMSMDAVCSFACSPFFLFLFVVLLSASLCMPKLRFSVCLNGVLVTSLAHSTVLLPIAVAVAIAAQLPILQWLKAKC